VGGRCLPGQLAVPAFLASRSAVARPARKRLATIATAWMGTSSDSVTPRGLKATSSYLSSDPLPFTFGEQDIGIGASEPF
jgi:hypothetical protein